MMSEKLTAMVLTYEPRLTHSVWVDLVHRARTEKGLVRLLRRGVRSGEWVGWRLITIHADVLGDS